MKTAMRFARVLSFVVIAVTYFGCAIPGYTSLVMSAIKHQDLPVGFGMCLMVMLFAQIVWGVVAGTTCHIRGWDATYPSARITNLFALIFLEGLLAMPATIVLAAVEFRKTGKFFPSPAEARC